MNTPLLKTQYILFYVIDYLQYLAFNFIYTYIYIHKKNQYSDDLTNF